jgi:hypothetical protein
VLAQLVTHPVELIEGVDKGLGHVSSPKLPEPETVRILVRVQLVRASLPRCRLAVAVPVVPVAIRRAVRLASAGGDAMAVVRDSREHVTAVLHCRIKRPAAHAHVLL